MRKGLILVLAIVPVGLWAAIPPSSNRPIPVLKSAGAVHGGVAGTGFSLLDLRPSRDLKKKVERLVFDIGDLRGQLVKGSPGYFHAQVLKNPPRLVIDFAQMPVSKISSQILKERLSKSMSISGAQMMMDPVDQSLTVELKLKNNPQVKVFQVAGGKSTSKLVVDFLHQ